MKELIDVDSNAKMMSLVICGIKYGQEMYVMYSIKRDDDNDNIFVSKLVINSEGYVMDNNFSGGEKENLDEVITKIINKDSINSLNDNGIYIVKDFKLGSINKFSVSKCYVATYNRKIVKDIMDIYNLIDINNKRPVVQIKEVGGNNKGNFYSIALIVFGLLVLIGCIWVIVDIFIVPV